MRISQHHILTALFAVAIVFVSCDSDDDTKVSDPNAGVEYSVVGDQSARAGVNIVFIGANDKDKFNATVPSAQGAAFQSQLQAKLLSLNPNYTKNFLGLDAATFSGVLATDVLNVSTKGATSYYDGTNVLTGRKLDDDVIDFSFRLIFGGEAGTSNPTLITDHVDKNDKTFLSTFPYEAAPW